MEDFVNFETAKKLKEKGFPQVTFGNYNMQSACYIEDGRFYENGCITEVSRAYTAPTIAQALKWLREEKKLHVEPCVISREEVEFAPKYTYWSFGIMSIEGGYFIYQEYHKFNDDKFDSYEEAALAGIEFVLDNLI